MVLGEKRRASIALAFAALSDSIAPFPGGELGAGTEGWKSTVTKPGTRDARRDRSWYRALTTTERVVQLCLVRERGAPFGGVADYRAPNALRPDALTRQMWRSRCRHGGIIISVVS